MNSICRNQMVNRKRDALRNSALLALLVSCSAGRSGLEPRTSVNAAPHLSAAHAIEEFGRRLHSSSPGLIAATIAVDCGMHLTNVLDADVDAKGTFLVTGAVDKTARIWTLDTGRQLAVLRIPGEGSNGQIHAVAASPDGREVAVGGWEGTVYFFESANRRLQGMLRIGGTIDSLRYSKDGGRLAVGLWGNGGVRVFETRTYTQIFADRDFGGDCYGLDFNESGDLAVASWDRSVRVYSSDYDLLGKTTFPSRPDRVAFDPQGTTLLVGFLDTPTVRLLSVPSLTVVRELSLEANDPTDTLGAVAWSNDGGEIFASGRYDKDGWNLIVRWTRAGIRLEDWRMHKNTPGTLVGLRSGGLAVVSQDPLVGVLDRGGESRWSYRAEVPDFREASSLQISADASKISFFVDSEQTTRLSFDVHKLAFVSQNPSAHSAVVVDPKMVVTSWRNATDPALNGKALRVQNFEECRSLSIDAPRHRFLLGCEWGLYLFDDSGTLKWSRRDVPGAVRAAVMSDDGRVAVIAVTDGTIRWISADTGKERLALFVHGEKHNWVTWTPSGFYAGTEFGESMLVVNELLSGGMTDFISMVNFSDLMRRPDVVRGALAGAEQ